MKTSEFIATDDPDFQGFVIGSVEIEPGVFRIRRIPRSFLVVTGPPGPQGPQGPGSGDMLKSVYDPANVNEQLVGVTLLTATIASAIISQSQVTNLVGDLAGKQPIDPTLTALAAYNSNGLVTQVAPDTFVGRQVVAGSSKISVSDGDGVAGNPSVDVVEANLTIAQSQVTNLVNDLANKQTNNSTLTALSVYNTNGIITQTATDTFTGRVIAGTADQVTVANGDGVSGNPTISLAGNAKAVQFGITIDGGGVAITTGVKGYLRIPVAMTITAWEIVSDQSGSIVVDVWKDTYANYPPTVADTIFSTKPTLSSAQKNQNLAPTFVGAGATVAAGDYIAFNVESASTVQIAQLTVFGTLV